MRIENLNLISFGASYSEIMMKAMNAAKQQKNVVKHPKPNLYNQLIMKEKYFLSDEVNDIHKADYFSYLINSIKK